MSSRELVTQEVEAHLSDCLCSVIVEMKQEPGDDVTIAYPTDGHMQQARQIGP